MEDDWDTYYGCGEDGISDEIKTTHYLFEQEYQRFKKKVLGMGRRKKAFVNAEDITKIPNPEEFKHEIYDAFMLNVLTSLSDLRESYEEKERSCHPLTKDCVYFDILSTLGYAEKVSSYSYKITKKGLDYLSVSI